jgi:hypothetical protein
MQEYNRHLKNCIYFTNATIKQLEKVIDFNNLENNKYIDFYLIYISKLANSIFKNVLHKNVGTPSLYRTFWETSLIILRLKKEPEYIKTLHGQGESNDKKVKNEQIKNPQNIYIKAIPQVYFEKEVEQINSINVSDNKQFIKKHFPKYNIIYDQHNTTYTLVSNISHGGLSFIIDLYREHEPLNVYPYSTIAILKVIYEEFNIIINDQNKRNLQLFDEFITRNLAQS